MMLKNVLISFFCMLLSSFPSTTFWKDCPFSIVYSCLLCQTLITHRCMGLPLGAFFCSTDPFVCFCASIMLFRLLWPCTIVKCLLLCYFPSGLFWQFWIFYGPIEILGLFVENLMGNLIGFTLICRCCGFYDQFNDINPSNPRAWDNFPFL